MKGYYTSSSYWGWVGNSYMAFPTHAEYVEYMNEVHNSPTHAADEAPARVVEI